MFSLLDHRKREMHVHFHMHLDEEDHHDHKSNAERRHCEKSSPGKMGNLFLSFLFLTIDQISCVESYQTYIRYANINYGANRYLQGNYLFNQNNSVKIAGKKSVN